VGEKDELLTRKRLEETRYFCVRLSEAKNDDEFHFNLSAFLNAWRSILDVMLYDFTEYYSLGFSREDELNYKEFKAVATALKNTQALKFIKWLGQKQGGLTHNNPLWSKRNITVHRGYPKVSERRIYVSGSGGTSGTVSIITPYFKRISYPSPSTISPSDPSNYYFSDIQDRTVMKYCNEALKEIESIIVEAEQTFSVKL
jgi:hypothetical protein